MEDKLEKFIKENKSEFDLYTPDPQLWLQIQSRIETKKETKTILLLSLRIAAAMVTILTVGILIGIAINNRYSGELNYAHSPSLQSFQETESFYQQQVSLKLDEVKTVQPESNIEYDLKQLDEIYNELKEELIKSNYANSDILINAMIKNHKTKVEILESILEKQNKNKIENEKISI